MTATNLITILLLICALLLMTLSAIGNAWRVRKLEQERDAWEELATQRSNHAQSFANAPRIIEIDRSGRILNITVQRGDEFFHIETMAMLSDNVPLWRRQCGLTAE